MSLGNCGRISEDILIDCSTPLVGGNKDRLILINYDDVELLERNISNPQIIEGINLVASPAARAYQFEGKNNSIDTVSTLVKGKYSENYNHQVVFRIFGDGPDIKAQIEQMVAGKFMAVLEKNYRGTGEDAAFELRGIDVGLRLTVMEKNDSDQDTQGAYVMTLSSPDVFKEPHLPATIFITDYPTTLALVNSLIV